MIARIPRTGILSCAGAALVSLSAVALAQQDAPAVVPYRPSVATPADLPAPGWPEIEAGWNGARGGEVVRSQSVPIQLKLAWSESWGLLIGTDAYDWQRDVDGSVAHSGGDTTLALKYRLPVGESVSLGAQLGVALPTARPPIGAGKLNWGGLAIASFDWDLAHVDVNVGGARLGAVDEGQGRWQGSWAVAVSHALPQGFGITGELSGLAQRGTSAQVQALAALNYNVSRQLVLDIGVAAGLSHLAPEWQLMGGLTVQLGRWF